MLATSAWVSGWPSKITDPGVGRGYVVDYSYEGCLAGTVRAEEPVDFALRHRERHVVECHVGAEAFRNVVDLK